MPNKMLIDASHPEETRVVVLRGSRVEEFDFESASKKQLRGNIYLAKVTRVEPSLQAAFVDYGGNRHGFLAFSEIHPDYYQIPVVDRQALIEEDAKAQRDEEEDDAGGQRRSRRFRRGDRAPRRAEKRSGEGETLSEPYGSAEQPAADAAYEPASAPYAERADGEAPERQERLFDQQVGSRADSQSETIPEGGAFGDEAGGYAPVNAGQGSVEDAAPAYADYSFTEAEEAPRAEATSEPGADEAADDEDVGSAAASAPVPALSYEEAPAAEFATPAPSFEDDAAERPASAEEAAQDAGEDSADAGHEAEAGDNRPRAKDRRSDADEDAEEEEEEQVEQLGGDAMEEALSRPRRYRKQYKIQEVIKRRQVLLVQVVKEERGNKGAALTTYLSLAGRYSVLMPNTARGGGISRKITDSTDRQRLKSIAQELEVPEGMGVILRTAGASRTKGEVKRDFEYLLRMWETVRETTLKSTAPTLVYEEGSLIKRSIRDLYNKDIDDIIVAGDKGFREARDFMRLLMPTHVRSVQPYRDPQPIFSKSGVEAQLDAMFLNHVTLKSGGYIVINQTEALVAIDVNSGRSTREHNIEDTALRTNLEAADEVARQLRLRDLAGLIVVDFIDMEEGRNNRSVERRMKDALKNDRARIQIGRISHFGLLEMSRQRIRTGVLEGSTEVCPHCSGSGILRSTASIALHVLRIAEDALIKSASHDLIVKTRSPVALYILNEKRGHLRDLERRFGVRVTIGSDDALIGGVYHALERGEPASGGHEPLAPAEIAPSPAEEILEEEPALLERQDAPPLAESEEEIEAEESRPGLQDGEGDGDSEGDRRRRRRRRRRGRGGEREGSSIAANAPQPPDDALALAARIGGHATPQPSAPLNEAFFGEPALSSVGVEEDGDQEAGSESPAAESPDVFVDEGESVEAAPLRSEPVTAAAEASEETEAAPAKAPERRRPRRTAKAREAAEAADQAPELALSDAGGAESRTDEESEAAPAKRARRTTRARAPRRSAAVVDAADLDAAAGDGGAAQLTAEGATATQAIAAPDAVEASPSGAVQEPAAEPAAAQPTETSGDAAGAPEATELGSRTWEPAPQEPQDDPSRPKRSGWWQRAKASLSR